MRTFFISDLHLGHFNITTFTDENGNRIRPFDSVDEMHQRMEDQWNSIVGPKDHVYVLGDLAIKKSDIKTIERFNGKKRLVMGNHDPYPVEDYLPYFEKICGVRVMDGAVLTHVPIHPGSLNRRAWVFNIHGHLHQNEVKDADGKPDLRYFNVSCERLDYLPIERDEILELLRFRGLPLERTLKFL